MAVRDYYEVLQVHRSAEPEVIEAAYRRLARKYHPDVNNDPAAALRMRELNEAFEVLSDPAKRARYDDYLSTFTTDGVDDNWHESSSPEETGSSVRANDVDLATSGSSQASGRAWNWLRWPAVLPAAVLAAIVVTFPVHWLVIAVAGVPGDEENVGHFVSPETLERLAVVFFAPVAFLYAGAKTAPSHRVHTSVVLAVLWSLMLGAGSMYGASQSVIEGWGWAEFGLAFSLGVGGILAGLYAAYSSAADRRI